MSRPGKKSLELFILRPKSTGIRSLKYAQQDADVEPVKACARELRFALPLQFRLLFCIAGLYLKCLLLLNSDELVNNDCRL